MNKSRYNSFFVYLLLGISLLLVGIFSVIWQVSFIEEIFYIIGYIFFLKGLMQLYNYYIKRKSTKFDLINFILHLAFGVMFIFFTNIPIYFSFIVFSFYILIKSVIYFFSFLNYYKDKVSGSFIFLVWSLCLLAISVIILLFIKDTGDLIVCFVGIYSILLGLNYCKDAVLVVIPDNKKNILKRRIRISIPAFIGAIIPKISMDFINKQLEIDNKFILENPENQNVNLEIFIHVTPDGFGSIGHCDMYIDGKVLSYGNYDEDSIRVFDSMGDGVLVEANKQKYIPFCIKNNDKTIFSYGLHLTESQIKSVRKAIKIVKKNSYEWFPDCCKDKKDNQDYGSKLYLYTDAKFLKFKKGKLKTYFVLGSNCVKLVEEVVGKSGQDIVLLNGIISPGGYQNYLEKEFVRANSQVIQKSVYNKQWAENKGLI